MVAIGLACLSAVLFGGMSVCLRIALNRYRDVELATVATVAAGFAVAVVFAAAEAPSRGLNAGAAWPFFLSGLLQPGIGQLLVTLAIREAGAARASVVLGAAPLTAVTIALIFLGEPLRAPLIVGAVLIVAGGFELARETDRPEHLRAVGLAYAFVAVVLFSVRDNVLRHLARDTTVPPGVAAAAALLGGTLLIAVVLGARVARRPLRSWLPFVPVGLFFGSSYVALFEAYYRGRVTVVSPLVATESLWGVLLSLLLLRHSELVGRRLLIGAALIVLGGVLIGAFR
jgi:drug/metabolite transporter (DMT)-like permease